MQLTSIGSSGVEALDTLIDGLRVGDNVVVVLGDGAPGDWLVDRFIAASQPDRLIVADATGRHADLPSGVVLDWSPGAGGALPAVEESRVRLADADARIGEDARFVADSLSAPAAAWGRQGALDLFLWACPRLYRRKSVALWIVQESAHDTGFLRRLTGITQVVVAVRRSGEDLRLEVGKADGRPPSVQGRAVTARLVDGDLRDVRPADPERQRLGEWLRDLRTGRGVGQADLARRVGISPSALSQAERGTGRVSAETLMRIWEALDVPTGPGGAPRQGYRLRRRGQQTSTPLAAGVTAQQRSDEPAAEVWHLRFAPRATGRTPLFAVKSPETVTVLRGVLQLDLGGCSETVHEGDTLIASHAAITAWSNPADAPAEAMWVIAG